VTVAVFFVLDSPNKIEINGEMLDPGQVGERMKEVAKSAYAGIRDAAPPADLARVPNYPEIVMRGGPLDMDATLLAQYGVPPTPFNITPPDVPFMPTGKAQLATILPPGKPQVFQGRNRATLPKPVPLLASAGGAMDARGAYGTEADSTEVQDTTWVTITAPVFREKQREVFRTANYDLVRMGLYLTRVFVQRRQLNPDGTWSEPKDVTPYTYFEQFDPVRFAELNTAEGLLSAIGAAMSGGPGLTVSQQRYIWRPPLAPYIDAYTWDPPSIEGITWQDWLEQDSPGSHFRGGVAEVAVAADENPALRSYTPYPGGPTVADRPRSLIGAPAALGGVAAADARPMTDKEANTKLAEARKAKDQKKLTEAWNLVNEILANRQNRQIRPATIEKTESLYTELRTMFEEEQKREAARQRYRQEGFEAKIEPLWAHDLTAEPGATYQYRTRIEVINMYYGMEEKLTNPADAQRLVLTSDFSEWSDAITVRPDTYFFFRNANRPKGTAGIEMYKWAKGTWNRIPTGEFGVGETIAAEDRKLGRVDTRKTITNIAFGVERSVRKPDKKDKTGRAFVLETTTTDVLVVADPLGSLEERILAEDRTSPELDRIKAEIEEAKNPRPRPDRPTSPFPVPGSPTDVPPPLQPPKSTGAPGGNVPS